MKLTDFHVLNFRSIIDSNKVKVGEITCFVGKNEAGKTATLNALHRLNPLSGEGEFNVIDDYPRMQVKDYQHDVAAKKIPVATPITATFTFENNDLEFLEEKLGKGAFRSHEVKLSKHYDNTRSPEMDIDEAVIRAHLWKKPNLPPGLDTALQAATSTDDVLKTLATAAGTAPVPELIATFNKIKAKPSMTQWAWDEYVAARVPKFLYFDEYYRMTGQSNLQALKGRIDSNKILDSDLPLIGLINLARLTIEELINPQVTQELKNTLQAAGAQLTKTIIKFWSQNKHIRLNFDVRPGLPKDPEGMRTGMNIWGEVYDTKHLVSTGMGTRSRGFVWFFSFLAWYSDNKKKNENIILLLDEPGLTLHGRAQGDLLRYFEEDIKGTHQLLYTTHSPFMIDPSHWDRVRIVQDIAIDLDTDPPKGQEGTRVITEVLEATNDSLFPLQGALGYDIYQALFIGPNCAVVEGVSDLLYIQSLSALLQAKGQAGLSKDWTITPVGGSDKVPTFVSLIRFQKGLNVAVLIDYQKKDQQIIQSLYEKKLLAKEHVHTYAHYTGTTEADIEDMFEPDFYLKLVNAEFKVTKAIAEADLTSKHPRILERLEEYIKTNPLPGSVNFNHYRPARYLAENMVKLKKEISKTTLDRFAKAFSDLNQNLKK